VNPESVKQSSQTDKQMDKQTQTSDSFTKSTAADEALRSLSDKAAKTKSVTTVNTELMESSAASASRPSPGRPKTANINIESQAINTEMSSATTTNVETSAQEEFTSQNEEIISELSSSSSSSKYTAAEIAEYDLDGDGEIDSTEEALMILEKTKKAAADKSSNEISFIQIKSREAYETAKWQMQATPVNFFLVNFQA